MFWGLIIEPHKRYAQTVEKSFHVSMACLEFNSNAEPPNEMASVMLDFENQEYILCNLHKQRSLQSPLDLNFKTGDKIAFFSSGKSRVHLTGYILEEDFDDEDDEDGEDNTLDMCASDEEMDVSQNTTQLSINNKLTGKRKKESPLENKKKAKLTPDSDSDNSDIFNESDDEDEEVENEEVSEDEDSDDEESEEEEDDDEDDGKEELPKKVLTPDSKNKNKLDKHLKNKTPEKVNENQDQKKKKNKTPNDKQQLNTSKPRSESNGTPASSKKNKSKGNESQINTPKGQSPANAAKPLKKTLQGGVAVEDTRLGTGAVAKAGKRVTVYYIGRLKSNNKQFDSTMQGPGFKFHLGGGEVIKGWDIGVQGMKVGGKRRIICPPGMAYGDRGSPPVIPPQSTLVFEVELKSVN